MKQRRLQQALSEATELRAFIVLIVLLCLRAWRIAPDLLDIIIEHWRQRVNIWLTYHLYHQVHWAGTTPFPLSSLSGAYSRSRRGSKQG